MDLSARLAPDCHHGWRGTSITTRPLTDDFAEFSSSGRMSTKQETMVVLAAESPTQVDIGDFEVSALAS